MERIIGKVYVEDKKESVKITPRKDVVVNNGVYSFRKGKIYNAIRDQHGNLHIHAFDKEFNINVSDAALCFKVLQPCILCGRLSKDLYCDRCKDVYRANYLF